MIILVLSYCIFYQHSLAKLCTVEYQDNLWMVNWKKCIRKWSLPNEGTIPEVV
jgi:hypothetical protein